MKLTKKSPFTGIVHSMEIPITQKQLDNYESGNKLIQVAFPNLTAEQREFIMTGITPREWNKTFKDKE